MKDYFIIYGVSDCPACLEAQADLMRLYPEKEYIFVSMDFSEKYRQIVKEKYSFYTLPVVVFVGDREETLIGGRTELFDYCEAIRRSSQAP